LIALGKIAQTVQSSPLSLHASPILLAGNAAGSNIGISTALNPMDLIFVKR